MPRLRNGLSIDVEEYFHVEAVADRIAPSAWEAWPSRVEAATEHLLEILSAAHTRATFFVLGWLAERHPRLVERIAAGHEVACHGYAHQHIRRMDRPSFRADVHRAKAVLEDLTGQPVLGYRAPTFSITRDTAWALDILVGEGFLYDSSIFPVHHDRYGMPGAPRVPHVIERGAGRIVELPPLTGRVLGTTVPLAGGGYLRLLPLGVVKWGIRRMNRAGQPAVVYLHPWEADAGQPEMGLTGLNRFRHRVGLARTAGKLERLLRHAAFGPLEDLARAALD